MKIINVINVILVSILLTSSISVSAKAPPPGSGKADVPANILLMLDTSGSMNSRANNARLFEKPTGICIDSQGNQFIVEEARHKVLKFDIFGSLVKVIGGRRSSANGSFQYPFHCAIDSNDNLYVTDWANNRAQKFDNDGNFISKSSLYMSGPAGIEVDTNGDIYVGESYDRRIIKYDSNWNVIYFKATDLYPYSISIHNGIVYSVNMWQSRNSTIKRFYANSGNSLSSIRPADGSSYLAGITVNDNGIYLAHTYDHMITKQDHDGNFIRKVGRWGTGPGRFRYVWAVGSDAAGNIYATDWYNHRVNKFTKDLVYLSDLNGSAKSRLQDAIKVIKQIVSSAELNKSANFGLMTWDSKATMRVPVSSSGASEIFKMIDGVTAPGMTYIQYAMELAKSYLRGANTPMKYSCQRTMLIVITDGGFNGSVQKGYDAAKDLYDNSEVPTVVISFHGGSQATHKALAKAGGTYTDDGIDNDISPIVSSSWQTLYNAVADMVRQTVQSKQTFTKPVILPGVSGGSDYIFQSTFLYKNFNSSLGTCTSDGKSSESCQWEGHLNKYKLKDDGKISTTSEWDAGALLNSKNSSNRKIWSMMKFMGADTSINNFNTSNLIEIKMIIDEASGKLSTDAEVTDLINFVRGVDAYDEDKDGNKTEQRWKLGDIYHSELKVVGKPNYSTTSDSNRSNTEAYYRYQNKYDTFKTGNTCGGDCATRKEMIYVGANDGMLHAFDAATGEEEWAFIPPAMIKNLPKMSSSKPNTSNSIYGVDGSIVVKDIYYDKDGSGKKWYTVLIAGQGRGGHSYFALDITKPLAPEFLFAFENDVMDSRIYHWDGAGNRQSLSYVSSITDEYNYSKLGESWSVPSIVPMVENKTVKWVATFAAGYNGGVNTAYGSSIYVIDLENKGKVLKRVDLADYGNNIANSAPASLVSVTADGTSKANYKGSMLYVADLEGKKWKLNLTDKGTLYALTPIFNAEATVENDRMEFYQMTPTIGTDNNLWNYYGTGNQQKVQTISSNIQNRIFGIKDQNFPDFKAVNGLSNTASSSLKNTTTAGSACPGEADLGWYINLGANERITGKLALYNEILYATRYKPDTNQICEPGKATLTEHKNQCGSTERIIELGSGIATGAVVYKGNIYLGVSGEGSEEIKDSKGVVVGKKENNIIVVKPKSKGGAIGVTKIKNESWREVF